MSQLSPWSKLKRDASRLAHGAAARLPHTRLGRVSLALVALASLVLVIVLALYMGSRHMPEYWQRNEKLLASDNATLLQLANTFEQRALRELSGSRQPQPPTRTVYVSFEEINAWIHIKLEDYMANRGHRLPREVRHPMLAGRDGVLILAFEYHTADIQQVVSVELQPVFNEQRTKFKLNLLGAKAGLLPLPVDTLRRRAMEQSPQAKKQVQQVFDMLGNQWLEAVQHHPGDARLNLRVTNIKVDQQGLTLQLRSEPRIPIDTATQPATPALP